MTYSLRRVTQRKLQTPYHRGAQKTGIPYNQPNRLTGVQVLVLFVGCLVDAWLGCWWFCLCYTHKATEALLFVLWLLSFMAMPGLCRFLRVTHTHWLPASWCTIFTESGMHRYVCTLQTEHRMPIPQLLGGGFSPRYCYRRSVKLLTPSYVSWNS